MIELQSTPPKPETRAALQAIHAEALRRGSKHVGLTTAALLSVSELMARQSVELLLFLLDDEARGVANASESD